MTVRLTPPGAGERFSAGPVTFRVLDDGSAVDGRSGVVECQLAPGWGGPPQHIHREHDETFYIVSGTVRFTSETDILIAKAGSLVTAPVGDPAHLRQRRHRCSRHPDVHRDPGAVHRVPPRAAGPHTHQ
jgi:mannose-6-phosphate isomerase-like protein (cupin superfamily)